MADNELTIVKLTDRQNHMRTAKGLKLVRELCAQLVGDADSFHGCIWPGNIVLNESRKWTLGPGSDTPVAQRSADEVEYLAPEYFWDGTKSAAADVYSLGLFLYAAYNRGRMPFQAKNKTLTDKDRSAALRRRMKGETVAVTGSISTELKAVISKALSYDPEKRFISAAELLAALEAAPEAISAGEDTVPQAAAPVQEAPVEEAPVEEAPVEEAPVEETSVEETLSETPDTATAIPETNIADRTPDAESVEQLTELSSADSKKYTVRKDFEENLVTSRKTSSRRRRKRVSPLVPILCILAAGILLVVVLLIALRTVNDGESNEPVIPSDPYIIIPSETESKETIVSESTDTPESTGEEAAPGEETEPAQTGSVIIDGKTVDPAEGTVYVAESGSKLRTGPGTSYDVADSLARGTALELTGTVGDDWSQVHFNGSEYYISNALISDTDPTGKAQETEAQSEVVASAPAASGEEIGILKVVYESNVRSGPDTSYDKLGIAKVGDELSILDISSDGKWYKVDFNGKAGYINRNMVSVIEIEYSATATVISDVNIRSGPGTGYDKVDVAYAGDTLTVIGFANGWYKVSVDSKTGYVAGNFVTIR